MPRIALGELVASMEDDPDGTFGSRAYTLTLSEAIDRGICAPYQVVCANITDTQLQAAQLLGVEGRSDEVRGARLAALQTALRFAGARADLLPGARLVTEAGAACGRLLHGVRRLQLRTHRDLRRSCRYGRPGRPRRRRSALPRGVHPGVPTG